jgi:hypothetical protein
MVDFIGIGIDYTRDGVGTIHKFGIGSISTTIDCCFIKVGITQS